MKNLPTDLLRTFVAVVDEAGFSSASAQIGRSQPAISLQIKRLQDLIGSPLLHKAGRGFALTEEGQVLLAYARSILSLNDEVVARLTRAPVTGVVRLGVPNEYADSFLPDILGRFAQQYPDVAIEVGCELSTHLLAKLQEDAYDVVFSLHTNTVVPRKTGVRQAVVRRASARTAEGASGAHATGWAEALVWVSSAHHQAYARSPLPLIVAPKGCVYRQRMLETLERAGRPWKIAYTSPSFGGIKAGVQAGLGVTVLANSTVPEGFLRLGREQGMPLLDDIRVHVHYHRDKASEADLALVNYMVERLARTMVV